MKVRDAVLGLKAYHAGKPISEVKRELGITDIIKLASNENPLGCSPKVTEAIRDISDKVNLYPDASNFELKKALSEYLNVPTNMIFCGTGSDLLIRIICSMVLNPGDESIMGEVSFQRYEDSTQLFGGKSIKIPMKNYGLDLEKMVDAITDRTKIIWICTPNNPTGPIVYKDELEKALKRIPEDVLVVMDEAYHEYVEDERYPQTIPMLKDHKNMIVLRTFSKAYGLAGLRTGYGIADKEVTAYINSIIGPFDTNLVAQVAGVAALKDQEFIKRVVELNSKGRKYMYKECDRLGLEYIKTQSNFIMINTGMDDKIVSDALLRRGVIIRPGYLFGMDGWLRVTIGTMEQNERFIKELEAIVKNK